MTSIRRNELTGEIGERGLRLAEERQREAFLVRAADAVSSGALSAGEAAEVFGFDVDAIVTHPTVRTRFRHARLVKGSSLHSLKDESA